ncbi:MAG TPA: MFS transporter [Acetobacteraceae bacterium]|nr:MFS transporter [Acetobacteraceae bacterium]
MPSAIAIAAAGQSQQRWWVLSILVAAQFMFVVDAFVLNVAIPSIRAELHATIGETQGAIVIYQIAFATLIITGGRLGDIYGARPVFLYGLLGFTLASLSCGLAQSGSALVAWRAVQGAAAALMIPQVLASIHRLFPDAERGRAFGAYGFTLGFGAAVGLAFGGWLLSLDIDGLGWRTIFFVNVPIGAALLCAAWQLVPATPGQPGKRIDAIGAAVLLSALICLLGPLLFGADHGWPAWLFVVMTVGVALLASLWRIERWVEGRPGGLPLIHLDLLCDRGFATGLAAVFFFTFANLSFYLVMMLYLQLGLHLPALQAGSVVLPLALAFALMSRVAGPRAQRLGIAALLQGCGVQLVGLLVVAIALAFGISASQTLATLLVVWGIGQAMVMAPLYGLVLAKVPAAHAGSGGGVISTMQQIGNASGVALIGALYYAVQAAGSARLAILASLLGLGTAIAITAMLLRMLRPRRVASHQELGQ